MSEFQEGDSASFTKTVTSADVDRFADISGDTNPVHLDADYAARTRFGTRIAHGLLTASLISAVIGTKLPGPGAIYLSQTLQFLAPVYLDDTISASVTVMAYDHEKRRMTLATSCTNQNGVTVLSGEASVVYRPVD